MTKAEFEHLTLDEQLELLFNSELWNGTICHDYEITDTDRINERIEQGVVDELRSYGFEFLHESLELLMRSISGHTGYVYRDLCFDGWNALTTLTKQGLSEILDQYICDELFEEPPEEEVSFDRVEELI